jgi:hypothetical protein
MTLLRCTATEAVTRVVTQAVVGAAAVAEVANGH